MKCNALSNNHTTLNEKEVRRFQNAEVNSVHVEYEAAKKRTIVQKGDADQTQNLKLAMFVTITFLSGLHGKVKEKVVRMIKKLEC